MKIRVIDEFSSNCSCNDVLYVWVSLFCFFLFIVVKFPKNKIKYVQGIPYTYYDTLSLSWMTSCACVSFDAWTFLSYASFCLSFPSYPSFCVSTRTMIDVFCCYCRQVVPDPSPDSDQQWKDLRRDYVLNLPQRKKMQKE